MATLASIKKAIEAKESFLERVKSIATFNIVSHMESLVILSSAESQIESQIKELEEKIEKLEFFVAQVSQYFSDSLEVLRLAIQGATQLSKIIVDSDGNYYADGVDMSWVQKMKDVKIESLDYKEENKSDKFINLLVEQYGFDKEMSGLITEISTLIDEKFPYLSQTEREQLLLVTLGSFIYSEGFENGESMGDKAKGYISDVSWMDVAGTPSDITGLPLDGKTLLKHLGLTDNQITKLRYNIRLQSQISSGIYRNYAGMNVDERKKYKSTYEKVYGVQLTDEMFEEKWNEKYSSFYGKGDFAHFSITTASNLNNRLRGSDLTKFGHENVNDFAGWLGDATLTDSNDISFGNDDYKADLDAVNITQKMKRKKISYIEASNEYYSEMKRGEYTRAEKFVEYKSVEEIKQKIFTKLLPDNMKYVEESGMQSHFELPNEEQCMAYLQKNYPSTYNFIRNIETGNQELTEMR
ncbi:ATP-binding protein [Streptococcus sp. Marseille-Q8145]